MKFHKLILLCLFLLKNITATFLEELPNSQIDFGNQVNSVAWRNCGEYLTSAGNGVFSYYQGKTNIYTFDTDHINLEGSTSWDTNTSINSIAWNPVSGQILAVAGLDDNSYYNIKIYQWIDSTTTASPQFRLAENELLSTTRYQTAFHLKYKKDHEKISQQTHAPKPTKSTTKATHPKNILPPNPTSKISTYLDIRNQELTDTNGNLVLDETTGTKFSISTEPLNLTLKNGSILSLRPDNDVTLKADDIINIEGNNNEIHIAKNFYVNGQLLFNSSSELKIIFSNPSAKIIFATSTAIDLEQSTNLSFEGEGYVEFGDGSVINFKGASSSPDSKPNLILQGGTKLSPATNATLILKGIGNILIDSGKIELTNPGTIIVGDAQTDEFDISILGNGMLRLQGTESGIARMSLQKGTFTLTSANNGTITIDSYGWLEINSLNGGLAQGNFKTISLIPCGQLSLTNNGKISFTANRNEYDHNYIVWNSINTLITGATTTEKAGIIEYVSKTQSQNFAGKIQTKNVFFNSSSNGLTAEQLVRTLINELDPAIFPTATLFTDIDNQKWIRLKNGVKIKIIEGDTLLTENTNYDVSGIDQNDNEVVYSTNGIRYNQ